MRGSTAWEKEIEDLMLIIWRTRADSTPNYYSDSHSYATRLWCSARGTKTTKSNFAANRMVQIPGLDVRLIVPACKIKAGDYSDSNNFLSRHSTHIYWLYCMEGKVGIRDFLTIIAWREKLAFGISQIVFNPLRVWIWRDPMTALFRVASYNWGLWLWLRYFTYIFIFPASRHSQRHLVFSIAPLALVFLHWLEKCSTRLSIRSILDDDSWRDRLLSQYT